MNGNRIGTALPINLCQAIVCSQIVTTTPQSMGFCARTHGRPNLRLHRNIEYTITKV